MGKLHYPWPGRTPPLIEVDVCSRSVVAPLPIQPGRKCCEPALDLLRNVAEVSTVQMYLRWYVPAEKQRVDPLSVLRCGWVGPSCYWPREEFGWVAFGAKNSKGQRQAPRRGQLRCQQALRVVAQVSQYRFPRVSLDLAQEFVAQVCCCLVGSEWEHFNMGCPIHFPGERLIFGTAARNHNCSTFPALHIRVQHGYQCVCPMRRTWQVHLVQPVNYWQDPPVAYESAHDLRGHAESPGQVLSEPSVPWHVCIAGGGTHQDRDRNLTIWPALFQELDN